MKSLLQNWWRRLDPSDLVTPEDTARGLRAGHWEAALSFSMLALYGGPFLTGWAVHLGASMTYLGLLNGALAATMIAQLPAAWWSARLSRHKRLWTLSHLPARALWLVIAVLPFFIADPHRLLAIALVLVYASFGLMQLGGPAQSAWLRDFVPEEIRGRHFGTRFSTGLAAGAVFGVLGGLWIRWAPGIPHAGPAAYSVLFGLAGVLGVAGVLVGVRQPEHCGTADRRSFLFLVSEPLRDARFRNYLHFTLAWNFAAFLAAPFGTAYILKRLHFDTSLAVGAGVLFQGITAACLPMWGRLSDRFTSKSVLTVACPLALLTYPVWILAGQVASDALRLALLLTLHVMAGLSAGGAIVASGNLLMKFAPRGRAAAYAGVNATAIGIAALAAPWLGGRLADRLEHVELSFSAALNRPGIEQVLPMVRLAGLDYVFLAALVAGLYGWHRLLAISEEGEVEEQIILGTIAAGFWSGLRVVHQTTVRGIRGFTRASWTREG